MPRFLSVILLGSLLLMTACAGVRFADEGINKGLPEDWKNRIVYKQTDILKYDISQIPGQILFCTDVAEGEKDCKIQVDRYVKNGTGVLIKTPEAIVYNSKIDSKASAQGSYLAFAAQIQAGHVEEVSITDSIVVYYKFEDVPIAELKRYAATVSSPPGVKRYWIQGALLSTINRNSLTEIDADAKSVIGNTAGVSGKVYNKGITIQNDYRLSFLLADLDDRPSVEKNRPMSLKSVVGMRSMIKGIDDPSDLDRVLDKLNHGQKGFLINSIK